MSASPQIPAPDSRPPGPGSPGGGERHVVVAHEPSERTALAALDALHRLQAALASLEDGQARLSGELVTARRRSLGVLTVLAVVVLVGLGYLWGRDGGGASREEDPGQLALELRTLEEERDDQIEQNLVLRDQLAEQQARIEELAVNPERLESAIEERNRQLGLATRLREQLIEKDQRINELMASIDDLRRVAARPEPTGVLVSTTSERAALTPDLVVLVNEALTASGVADFEVLEASLDADGVLVEVLVAHKDPWGMVVSIASLDRLELEQAAGVVRLRLVHAALEEGGTAAEEVRPLPRWPRQRWEATGLTLPAASFVPADRVRRVLEPILEVAGYRFDVLGGFEGGEMADVVLTELGPRGESQATLTAAWARLERDPQRLRLVDGTRSVDDVERPFYGGETVIPLEGFDLSAYWSLVP